MVPPAMTIESERRAPEVNPAEISDVVADNLKRHRADRGLSLSDLAGRSGVSRAMIHQIERRQSIPTINVVWKLATALDLPFAALLQKAATAHAQVLEAGRSWVLESSDGLFRTRALFPLDGPRNAELYELTLLPGASEEATPHSPGTRENLAVAAGTMTVRVDEEDHVLGPGDAIVFAADVPHAYSNASDGQTRAYLMMTYER